MKHTKKKTTDSQRSAVQATRVARQAEKRAEKKTVGGGEKQAEARPAEEACPVANAASERTRRRGRRNERAKLRRTKPATRGAESCAKKHAKARTLRPAGKSGEPETPDASPTQTPGSGSHAWPPWRKTGKGKPRAQLRPQEKKKESKERKKEKERRKERKKEKERERKKERKKKERTKERKKERKNKRKNERKKERKKKRKERKKKERTQRKHEKRRIWRELDASLRRTRVKKLEKTNTLSQRQRPPVTPLVRTPSAFNILTSKCASRDNGVHFFDI